MTISQPCSNVRQNRRRRRDLGWARPAQLALVAMGGVLLIYAQAVAALGVGEPRYLSHLFEPLRVDIPVDTRGVDPAAVKVGISFSGIDPAAAAAIEGQLHREWRADARGGHVLRVSTDQPIHEPLMQMRVEVGDDRIQAIRELTLLFDPAPVEAPPVSLLAQPTVPPALTAPATPIAVESLVSAERIAVAVVSEPVVEPIAIAKIAPIEASASVPAPIAIAPAARALAAQPVKVAPAVTTAVAPVVTAVTKVPAAAGIVLARPALLVTPTLSRPLAAKALISAAPVTMAGAPVALTAEARRAQIASTHHRSQALSGADRWQRLLVNEGDTLDALAERARGNERAIPLSMVAMLLRWLNPRSFDGIGNEPLVGAELRFPKPESLAAQIAVSGGIWTVDDVTATTADTASTVPPPAFQLLTADAMALALQSGSSVDGENGTAITAGAALLAARPSAASGLPSVLSGGRPVGGGLAASSSLVGGAVLASVLSMMLMLKMVVTTPTPQASRYVPAAVVARSVATTVSAAAGEARALPTESLDLASLDLGRVRQAETVRSRSES